MESTSASITALSDAMPQTPSLRSAESSTALSALLSREQWLPPHWRPAAGALGISNMDAFMCSLVHRTTTCSDEVSANAAESRVRLLEMRQALHVAIDTRVDDLLRKIDRAEAEKLAALERELVAVDAQLERYRSETVALREIVESLDDRDPDLDAKKADLAVRLGALGAHAADLAPSPLEPPMVGITTQTLDCILQGVALWEVVAPRPLTAGSLVYKPDVSVEGAPGSSQLRISKVFAFDVDPQAASSAAEALALAQWIESHAYIDASVNLTPWDETADADTHVSLPVTCTLAHLPTAPHDGPMLPTFRFNIHMVDLAEVHRVMRCGPAILTLHALRVRGGAFKLLHSFEAVYVPVARPGFSDRDMKVALDISRAKSGSIHIQATLGNRLYDGIGVPRDQALAVAWFAKAAAAGHREAACNLGICYAQGHGVEADAVRAAELFLVAAQGGSPSAQYNYGRCLAVGSGVPKDSTGAIHWWRRAAEAGHARAQAALAKCSDLWFRGRRPLQDERVG